MRLFARFGEGVLKNEPHTHVDLGHKYRPHHNITKQWLWLSIGVQHHGSPWCDMVLWL